MKLAKLLTLALLISACTPTSESTSPAEVNSPFVWENATIYFMLTDRFHNGNPDNDFQFDRKQDGAVLRDFKGGDFKGITQKIESGYFDDLGVNAIWMTPPVQQVTSFTDEGTGKTYGFHGYWAIDWTQPDPNFGTEAEFKEMVDAAHAHGIRVLMDAVLNHTGPVTDIDTQWPEEWVRTSPKCDFKTLKGTVECTLVENLPDIRTDSDANVQLPPQLVEKWTREGRLEAEKASLDAFFTKTGHPRAPRFYLMKWMADWVRKYGLDGFRVDTAKHTEASIWSELKAIVVEALRDWKRENPEKKLDDLDFYMTGEVYNYFMESGRMFDYGDQEVDFFDNGFESLINFSFKTDAGKPAEATFSKYSNFLNVDSMAGKTVLNYISSHDDSHPFDQKREKAIYSGTMLLLTPGTSLIYYGDESARVLEVEGTQGDAALRSFMNWEEIAANTERNGVGAADVLSHWQRLGAFRKAHISVGAGVHTQLQEAPYVFKRSYSKNGLEDQVLVAMGLPSSSSAYALDAFGVFEEGATVKDYYSGTTAVVKGGKLHFDDVHSLLLLAAI